MSNDFPRFSRCRAIGLFTVIAVSGLAADLLTKHWAFQALGMPGTYKAFVHPEANATYWIVSNVFGLQTSLNAGALFGLGQGHVLTLSILSVIFLVGILVYLALWAWRSLFLSAVLGMITAGICGNLYDRLGWHGLAFPDIHPFTGKPHPLAGEPIYAVRDWILCMFGSFPWPNFNIADSLLVCSVILLLIHELLYGKKTEPS